MVTPYDVAVCLRAWAGDGRVGDSCGWSMTSERRVAGGVTNFANVVALRLGDVEVEN